MILRPHPSSISSLLPRLRHSTSQSRSCPHFTRHFTTAPSLLSQPTPTHYDVLGVQPSVSPSDLKKRFYVLSRENHPDLHRNSKEHTTKFQEISESYSVLADPDKRRKYDRDVMRVRPSVRDGDKGTSSFAGSRPATGLSRRRSAFRGPPPSYFGGRASSQSQQNRSQSQAESESSGNAESAYTWGPEPQFGQTTDFNSQPVFRTQTVEDQRRSARHAAAAAAAQLDFDSDGDFWARFVMVTCVVIGGVMIAGLILGTMDQPKAGGMVKGDGTLRRGSKKKDDGS